MSAASAPAAVDLAPTSKVLLGMLLGFLFDEHYSPHKH